MKDLHSLVNYAIGWPKSQANLASDISKTRNILQMAAT